MRYKTCSLRVPEHRVFSDDDIARINKTGYNRFATLLGIEFVHIGDGRCEAHIDVHENLFHPGGIVHGGVAFSLADSTMAMALIGDLAPTENCSTIEAKVNYMKPVVEGRIRSEARVVRKGRKIAFVEARISCGDDLIATASGTFAILQP